MPEPSTPPRRFRFGLRTLFVVVMIVSIPCAWVGYSVNWIRQRREFLATHHHALMFPDGRPANDPGPAVHWRLRIFGERAIYAFWEGDLSDAELQRVSLLFPEAEMHGGHSIEHWMGVAPPHKFGGNRALAK